MGTGSSHLISLSTAEARLGEAELARVRKCFASAISVNSVVVEAGSGMSQSQFTSQVFGSPFAPSVARALFGLFDVKEKKELSEDDFVIGMAIFTRGTVEEKLEWLFSFYDLDRDGVVNRFDIKSMLTVDLITSALPPLEIGKHIDQIASEAVPVDGQGLAFADFCEWIRSRKNLLSLAQWALEDSSGKPMNPPSQQQQQAASATPLVRQADPLEFVVVALKNVVKGRLFPFLESRGYQGPILSDMSDDEALRKVSGWLLQSDKASSKRICWAYLGQRPPTREEERQTVAWLVETVARDHQERVGKDKGEERLEDSVERAIAPPAPDSAEASEASTRYLVQSAWYKTWNETNDAAGPVENAVLIQAGAFSLLRPGLEEGKDFVAVLPHVWFALCAWYGGGPAIHRPFLKDLGIVEVYALKLSVYVRKSVAPPASSKYFSDEKFDVSVSRADTVATLKTSLCGRLGCRVFFARLWKICEDNHFMLLSKELDTVVQSGLFEGANICVEVAFGDGTWPLDTDKRVATSGLSAKSGAAASRPPGSLRVGLRNLGNTCYMNAALQSLLATPALSKPYFANGMHRKELCLDNPIGFGGRMAFAFGELVSEILSTNSDVIAPSDQKAEIGTCNPDFAGFRQHDSQELLTWLLDALHEDLNRVEQKPYLEDPDDDKNQSDEDLAALFWKNHKARNDSIIVDLFHGQIKSTVRCDTCQTVYRKFDAFSSLGLPLPAEDMRLVEILLHPTTSPAFPTRYGFRLPKNASIMDLKVKLFELTGIKPRSVALFSIWNSRHDRLFSNTDKLDAIRDQDTLHGHIVDRTNPKLLLCNPPPRIEMFGAPPVPADNSDEEDDASGCLGLLFGAGGEKREKKEKRPKTPVAASLPPTKEEKTETPTGKDKGEFEDEMDSVMAGGGMGAKSSMLDACYVQVVHRRIDAAHETALFSQHIPRLFAWPLLLSFRVADFNAEQIYARVWELIKHMISHNFAQQQGSSDVAYPFRLSVVNHSGLACALCPWNKFCIGCPLTDALLNIDRHLVLGIDWNVQVLKMYFNNDAANRFETHVSVKENRELQDYPVSLGECLELFGREEQLEEFYCRKCKEHRSATKCLSLYRLPPLMCIHLKRFQEHRGRWEKTNKIVQFPLKELRFQGSQESFSLYATICHYGGLGGGHYTCSNRMPGEEQWHYCDDSRTRPLEDANMVVTRSAYVLFYASDQLAVESVLARVSKDGPDLTPRRAGRCVIL